MMAQQIYETVSIRDAWWNVVCQGCGREIADGPWREVKITWSEILQIAINLWGPPCGFAVRDFLIVMEFHNGQIVLIFCSQGSRRGEVNISVPMDDEMGRNYLAEFMNYVRVIIEQDRADWEDLEEIRYDEDDWDGREIL